MLKAVAIIRKVEDSPDWLDRRLVEAYLHTDYAVLPAPFEVIRIGQKNLLLEKWLTEQGFESYIFITAWNPGSNRLSKRQNQSRNKQLALELKKWSRLVLPGSGIGHDRNWPPEESFWALDVSPQAAADLGRQFGQNAIVWGKKDAAPELWWLK